MFAGLCRQSSSFTWENAAAGSRRKRGGGISKRKHRILQERLRIHHVERGGYALAADVCDHEREVRLVEHEEIVEVAADIPRRGHGRRQAEIGVFAKRHGQYGILDGLRDFHVFRPRLVRGGVKRPQPVCIAEDAVKEGRKAAEDQGQQKGHHRRRHVARAEELVFRFDHEETVSAEDETAAEGAPAVKRLPERPAGIVSRAQKRSVAFRHLGCVKPDFGERLRHVGFKQP